jgi:hypothetical protein
MKKFLSLMLILAMLLTCIAMVACKEDKPPVDDEPTDETPDDETPDDETPDETPETPDDTTEEDEEAAAKAAAEAAAAPVIEQIKALANWAAVTADNYESLKAEYETVDAAYDALDKDAKKCVDSDTKKILTNAKNALKDYENVLKAEAAEKEYQAKIETMPVNNIVKATVTIDGILDDVVANKSTPLALTKEQCDEWNNTPDLKAIGAGVVGDTSLTEGADTNVSFYFAYDDNYLYVIEKRCDLNWLFTTTDFRKPYASDGSLVWFTRGSNDTAKPICGIQWNGGTKETIEQANPRPGENVPVFGLFTEDDQPNSVKMDADAWERAIGWDDSTFFYVIEVKIPFADLGFTAADIESGVIGATFCSVDIVNEEFDGDTSKLWTGMGYQMQYPGVNSWKWCYRFLATN